MIYLKKDGSWGDTHEPYPEEELELIGDEIIEEVEEYYLDNCNVVEEYDDYRSWAVVEDAPDLKSAIEETIKEHTNGMTQDEINYITEYVNDNISSKDNLCDRAIERASD